MHDYIHEKGLYEKIRSLMILRVAVITTFLIGALFLYQWKEDEQVLWFLFGLIVFLYILTIIYSLFLNRIDNLKALAYVQIVGDVIFETGLIYISGGILSPLSFLYILSIITAAIILFTYGAYFIASMSCISYGLMIVLIRNDIVPTLDTFLYSHSVLNTGEILYKLFVNFCAFYLVAYLANYLIEGLRIVGQQLHTKEENLIRLQRLNDNILRSIDSGVMTVDLDGKIVSFNEAAKKITGFQHEDVFGKQVVTIFPIEEIIASSDEESGRFRRCVRQFLHKDGSERYLGFSRSTLYDEDGTNSGYIIIFQDLTEIRRLEIAKKRAQRMAILGELSARMAHEIRNPLTSMRGSIEIISKEQSQTSSNRKLMEIILRESDRLNRLITDFLQYARPHKKINKEFSIINILQETIILVENNPKKHEGITIAVDFPQGELFIIGDIFQIKQVFLNLFINALDAMPEGGTLSISIQRQIRNFDRVDISAEFSENAQLEDYFCISVRDTGYGIKEEFLEQIFTPFFSTKDGGTGLGLAIAYRIIEEHNGTIAYRTKSGVGTEFFIYLPYLKDNDIEVNRVKDDENEYITNC